MSPSTTIEETEATPHRDHPFISSPHHTLISMSLPVLFSLVAEPVTGLVDTAFVSRLGSTPLAALGVGSIALSSIFWVFNFLGIGTQTEVAQAWGRDEVLRVKQIGGLALALSGIISVLLVVLVFPCASGISTLLGATHGIHDLAVQYFRIRLFGAPAVLVMISAFGILRGLQDMRTPLWIAVSINLINIVLDAILIFGFGPVPPLGIAGAAVASVVSQWIGAVWVLGAVYFRLGLPDRLLTRDVKKILSIGGDLFVRTGLLLAFLLLTTRAATRLGSDSGAAHQAIRQVWIFTALFLDAFAITGQSLVGYFFGTRRIREAHRVAFIVCSWSLGTGIILSLIMWIGQGLVKNILVPPTAFGVFSSAWIAAVMVQPVNALAFATDGIHWGTGDYRFLRNVVIAATIIGVTAILFLHELFHGTLVWIWIITGVWVGIRAVGGIVRIWPGLGKSPLRER